MTLLPTAVCYDETSFCILADASGCGDFILAHGAVAFLNLIGICYDLNDFYTTIAIDVESGDA